MYILKKFFPLTIICSILFTGFHTGTSYAQIFTKPLKTEPSVSSEVKGAFTVILFGRAHADDLETVAFLDDESDQYTFEPFAPDFDYVMKKGLSGEEALAVTQKFVSFHLSFWKTQLRKIIGTGGTPIGFELRPLYLPFIYGTSDVLDIYYWPKHDWKIKITIRLIPSLENLKFDPGGDIGFSSGH
jgi:hypothetical protein